MGKSINDIAKEVIQTEADSVLKLKDRIDQNFDEVCQILKNCMGKVVLIGMGKSGHIAKKISSTLASTGTPAFYLHPAEAGHGDLGMISHDDVVIMISYSGESDEIISLLPGIKRMNVSIISMTGNAKSLIASSSDFHIDISVDNEACPNNLAPTSSTTATLVMGDAIAVSLMSLNNFTSEDFAMSHPSGSLGRRLLTLVSSIMKSGKDIPKVNKDTLLIDSLLVMSEKALGMVLIAENEKLVGIFTDGDLRRVLGSNVDFQKLTIQDVMTKDCKSIKPQEPALNAMQLMEKYSLNSLPVVDSSSNIVGAINMHTLIQAKLF
ncbi:MAG: KpsF/GutQ family sugar-phosphate isomerase [SAR86 cluster bacterium]|nr:KpsF/GutQ family sugar-phosphate isomerase [Candidatus Pseudothioglobus aerophilus]MBT3440077.1 KpsF/GutQ family sugar-phosphate isomerase [Gammaproteobacteria bacterium]MDO7578283.1 KpsF/GutQ family sugar-phosphate isomerase [SAR86 cluster bacterium]MDP0560558.1 KpsF/GutQ family sugar-phosphate isomerase [Candidatus Thioglobus sp.]MBT4244608.1 KpsF/GutQ family sugar-phosphate isomerase [Gammaproteobacteria bacterium]